MMNETHMNPDPYMQFTTWYDEAIAVISNDPEAMVLSTVGANGKPSSRVVLLRRHSKEGFVFFTNYSSRKGHELMGNANAALLFFWREMGRQIRIEGYVEKVSSHVSDEYFNTRPRGSRAAAMISPQSSVIKDMSELMTAWEKILEGPDEGLKRPKQWGGYILKPHGFEFWQAGEYRLHNRIRYRKEEALWVMERLAP